MKVYVVGGYNWGFESNFLPKVFLNKEDAETYFNKVKDKLSDVYDIFEAELETELKDENV